MLNLERKIKSLSKEVFSLLVDITDKEELAAEEIQALPINSTHWKNAVLKRESLLLKRDAILGI